MEAPVAVDRGFEGVTAYTLRDHVRLSEALCLASSAVGAGRFADAAVLYEAYELGLLQHFRIEEELLFPVFEARSGMTNGPTAAMRDEHRQARTALGIMRDGLIRIDAGAYGNGLRRQGDVL